MMKKDTFNMKMVEGQAAEVVKDKSRMERLLHDVIIKIQILKPSTDNMVNFIGDLKTSIKMLRSFLKGEYKGVSNKTILSLVVGLLYFLIPFDLVPDFIPVVGYMDDISVLIYIFRNLKEDIAKFQAWEFNVSTDEA
jgi:uncharacterized membrane protein YkvA (DUF1232 family)